MRSWLVVALLGCHAATPRPADEVAALSQLVERAGPDAPQRPELDFRLADALERRGDHDAALARYRLILETHRWSSYARRDEVLFWYAHALAQHAPPDAAIAALEELIVGYPSSKLRADAYITLADARFDRGDFAIARASYLAAAAGSAPLAWYARYRTAWCDFRLGEVDRARDEMMAVARAPADAKTTPLIAAALRDLSRWGSTADPSYLAAERAYAGKRMCEAAPLYAAAVASLPPGATRDEAAYAHVLATRTCEHLDDVQAPSEPGDVPHPIPERWQKLVSALDVYLATVTVSPEQAAIHFLRGRIRYGFAHLPEAAGDFRAILTTTPNGETVGPAATLLLDCDQRLHRPELMADLKLACGLPAARVDELGSICARLHP